MAKRYPGISAQSGCASPDRLIRREERKQHACACTGKKQRCWAKTWCASHRLPSDGLDQSHIDLIHDHPMPRRLIPSIMIIPSHEMITCQPTGVAIQTHIRFKTTCLLGVECSISLTWSTSWTWAWAFFFLYCSRVFWFRFFFWCVIGWTEVVGIGVSGASDSKIGVKGGPAWRVAIQLTSDALKWWLKRSIERSGIDIILRPAMAAFGSLSPQVSRQASRGLFGFAVVWLDVCMLIDR